MSPRPNAEIRWLQLGFKIKTHKRLWIVLVEGIWHLPVYLEGLLRDASWHPIAARATENRHRTMTSARAGRVKYARCGPRIETFKFNQTLAHKCNRVLLCRCICVCGFCFSFVPEVTRCARSRASSQTPSPAQMRVRTWGQFLLRRSIGESFIWIHWSFLFPNLIEA